MIKYCDRCEQDRYVTYRWDIVQSDEGAKVRIDTYRCITCGYYVETENVPIVYWVKTTYDKDSPVFKTVSKYFVGGSPLPVYYGPYPTWFDAFKAAKQIECPLVEIEEGLEDSHAENLQLPRAV